MSERTPMEALRSALHFAASRSCITSAEELAIMDAWNNTRPQPMTDLIQRIEAAKEPRRELFEQAAKVEAQPVVGVQGLLRNPTDSQQCLIRASDYVRNGDHRMAYFAMCEAVGKVRGEVRQDALEQAAKVIETAGLDPNVSNHLDARMCCTGHMCGCQGSTVAEYLAYQLRALKENPNAG